jgi:putative transposase
MKRKESNNKGKYDIRGRKKDQKIVKSTRNFAIKTRLCVSNSKQKLLLEWMRSITFVYNVFLKERKENYEKIKDLSKKEKQKHYISYVDQNRKLTGLKKENTFLYSPPSHSLQAVLSDLAAGYSLKYSGNNEKSPDFKKRKDKVSVYFPIQRFKKVGNNKNWRYGDLFVRYDRKHGKINLSKLGIVKFRWDSRLTKVLKNSNMKLNSCRLNKDQKYWLVSFAFVEENWDSPKVDITLNRTVGLNRGIVKAVQISTGENDCFNVPMDKYKVFGEKIAILQKKSEGQVRNSKRWKKTRKRISLLHRSVRLLREGVLHNISNKLINSFDQIVIENYAIKKMVAVKDRNEKEGSSLVKRGKKKKMLRKHKARLNRAILSQGWYKLYSMLHYKGEWAGKKVVRVDSKYITLECFECGCISLKNVNLKIRKFKCVKCGSEKCIDYNASLNVRKRGLEGVKV